MTTQTQDPMADVKKVFDLAVKLQGVIDTLKAELVVCRKENIALQRRIEELEDNRFSPEQIQEAVEALKAGVDSVGNPGDGDTQRFLIDDVAQDLIARLTRTGVFAEDEDDGQRAEDESNLSRTVGEGLAPFIR